MYAPHFAAALALKSRVPRAPLWALLLGSFMPDVFWVVLARMGIEQAQASNFFDDWSHSLLSVVILATLFVAAFCRAGWKIALAVWLAVFSHFLLDLPVHPTRLALYPLSGVHLGWDLVAWGSREGGWELLTTGGYNYLYYYCSRCFMSKVSTQCACVSARPSPPALF